MRYRSNSSPRIAPGRARTAMHFTALMTVLLTAACGSSAAPSTSSVPSQAAKASAVASASAVSPASTARPAASAASASAGGAPSAAAFQAQWDQLVAAAKKEGTVTVAKAPSVLFRQRVLGAFQNEFGVTVNDQEGSDRAQIAKMKQEKAAGVHSVDVFLDSCQNSATSALPAGLYAPIKPALILPDVNDPSKWVNGKPWYVDPNGATLIQLARNLFYNLDINPTAVDASQLKTAPDLVDPKWKGKIGAFDPSAPGPGTNAADMILKTMGEPYFRQLYLGQGVKLATEDRTIGDWLAHAAYPIGIGLAADELVRQKQAGLKIDVLKMNSPFATVMDSSSDTMGLMQDAPHPNAAKLFVNWMMTKPAMQLVSEVEGLAVTRADVSYAKLSPDLVPQPGQTPFNACDWSWMNSQRPQLTTQVKKILGH